MRTRLAAVAVIAVLALAGCTADGSRQPGVAQPPGAGASSSGASAAADDSCRPRASYRPDGPLPQPGAMPAGSRMREIQDKGELVLGTSQDTLLFSSRNPFTGAIEGFDVDMGRQIAEALFGDPSKLKIKVIGYDQREDAIKNGSVDIVADTMTANCDRWQRVAFSSTYYEAGQKVLVSSNSTAKRIEDLGGKRVCAAVGSTSLGNLAKVRPTPPKPVGMPTFGDCLVSFQQNQVDGISTDDTILAGMAAQDPYAKVIGPRFTEEPYGIAMSLDHKDLVRFVNAVLEKNRRDGTWAATYRRWLGGTAPAAPVAQYR